MARLQEHREEQAKAAQQTAALVQMLQETHRQLIKSNDQLLSQLQARHARLTPPRLTLRPAAPMLRMVTAAGDQGAARA